MVTVLIVMVASSVGRWVSAPSSVCTVSTQAMASTTSMPAYTWPNTVSALSR